MMTSSTISKEDLVKIKELFLNMNDSPGNESDSLALDWLQKHGTFSGFVDGKWLPKIESAKKHCINNPFTDIYYAEIFLPSSDILNKAAENSFNGLEAWSAVTAEKRSCHLRRIAQTFEKNEQLFCQVECVSSGKIMHRIKSKDVPNLIQNFNYYANWAGIMDTWGKDYKQTGVVCVISEAYTNSLLSESWRVSSILAGGNAVLLLIDWRSCLSAFLLAELCHLAGLPPGVLNVLPVDLDDLNSLPAVNKVIFNGSYLNSKKYIHVSAKQNTLCEVSRASKPVVIVYENADLYCACDGILEMLFFMETRSEGSCHKVFVQESIEKKFLQILEQKFTNILLGTNFSKVDMCCLVSKQQHEQLVSYIDEAKRQQFKILEAPYEDIWEDREWKPTLICNVPTTSKLFEKLSGPVVITTTFRTVKESIALFNCNKNTSEVSVWTERLTVGLEAAHLLKTRTIWLNSQHLFDASVPHGAIYRTGTSVEGGKEAFLSDLNLCDSVVAKEVRDKAEDEINTYGKETSKTDVVSNPLDNKQMYGQFIGGSFKKSGSYRALKNSASELHAYVSDGKLSDGESACASAVAGQSKWENVNKYKRSQILIKAADALQGKKDQFVSELLPFTGEEMQACSEEVEESVSRLRFWASDTDKCDGSLKETLLYGKVLQDLNPVGVIGIQCPDQKPLLSFISLVVPAIAFGNAIIAIASEKCPIPALKMCEILHSSGVPPGVLNVITGNRAHLTRHLCALLDIDAVWFSTDGASFIYNSCSTHPKKIFNCTDAWNHFNDATKLKLKLESTLTKTIFLPMGSIFAN